MVSCTPKMPGRNSKKSSAQSNGTCALAVDARNNNVTVAITTNEICGDDRDKNDAPFFPPSLMACQWIIILQMLIVMIMHCPCILKYERKCVESSTVFSFFHTHSNIY